MKYMGSKKRIAKDILPIILKDRKEGQYYVEPFCGGCNILDKVENPRIGNDVNKYLIALLKEMQVQVPFSPGHIGEEQYKEIQKNKDKYPEWLVGYAGFTLSFASKFFGGYRRDVAGVSGVENEERQNRQAVENLRKQQNNLVGVNFWCGSYLDLVIPDNSIIYCDPPYNGTTGYKDKFDHMRYYEWCREQGKKGHEVYMSEYTMPGDFESVWSKEVSSNLDVSLVGRRQTERLYILRKGQKV